VLTAHDWEAESANCEGITPVAAAATVSGAHIAANVIYEEVRFPQELIKSSGH
jgi:hypothetical protein